MAFHHHLRGRVGRSLGVGGAALLVAVLTPGCSGDETLVSPETTEVEGDFGDLTEEQRTSEARRSVHILERFVDAYNAREPRAFRRLYHPKYRFATSATNTDMPETMTRREVLRSTGTMLRAEDVLDVQLSMTYELPEFVRQDGRWFVAVDAVVDLEVTMENVFGPPIVYHVDHHPARFLLHPRRLGPFVRWSIVKHTDLYEVPDGERVEVPKTWSEVLHEFLER